MPCSFSAVCDLLQNLEDDLKRKRNRKGPQQIVEAWFVEHRQVVDHVDTDKCALLSTLLPERRTDRVLSVQHKTLSDIFAKAQCLPRGRKQHLTRYANPGSGVDLPECLEDILKVTPNFLTQGVTVEEIDDTLQQLAACNRFSSPAIRSSRSTDRSLREKKEALGDVFRRLSARDAKWFARLVLKSYLPAIVPEYTVYAQCHRLLPFLLKVHDDFTVVPQLLEQHTQDGRTLVGDLPKDRLLCFAKPQVGVKVGRQKWLKGRSIDHCLEMGKGLTSVEKKMDGEYCQVHIDLSKDRDCIQIFSKSGKDSTEDRIKLHGSIKSSLGLGTSSCTFQRQCILEGEMVVYSDVEERILGFDKIRKHVKRSGRYLGTDEDSQAHYFEHLMIVYFDVLLIDEDSLLNVRLSERHRRLSSLVRCQKGRAALVDRQVIDFSSRGAKKELQLAFASCIVNQEEGLVLKPDEPYFNFTTAGFKHASCCVKMKEGYFKGMGDVGDFAVVGARYDATRAKELNLPGVKHTHFYLGCLTNSEEVRRFPDVIPEFTVVNEVEVTAAQFQYFQRYCFTRAVAFEENDSCVLNIPPGILQGKKIATVFQIPAVFEMNCFSFQKAPNTRFWSLRFPYVSKIHCDRNWQECVSFDELQRLGRGKTTLPDNEDSQILHQTIEAMRQADPKMKRIVAAEETQSTVTTVSTVSTDERSSQHHRVIDLAAGGPRLTTPPTPSALRALGSTPQPSASARASSQKRRTTESPSSPRRVKTRRDGLVVIDLTESPPSNKRRDRQPLQDISSTPSSQSNVAQAPVPRLPRTETFHEVPNKAQSIPPATYLPVSSSFPSTALPASQSKLTTGSAPQSSADLRSDSSLSLAPVAPASSCRHAGRFCALANYYVLLSPCVANLSMLTEHLLPSHGVTVVASDTNSWLASLPRRTRSSGKLRALVLVDRRRHEATVAFLKGLQAHPVRQQDDGPALFVVYDWRLVEAVTDAEANYPRTDKGIRQKVGTEAHGREIWSRYYVGVC